MKNESDALREICTAVDRLLAGDIVDFPDASSYPPQVRELSQKLVRLIFDPPPAARALPVFSDGDGCAARFDAHIRHIVEHLHSMLIEVNAAGGIVFCNRAAHWLLSGAERLPYQTGAGDDMHVLIRYLCTFSNRLPCINADGSNDGGYPLVNEMYDSVGGVWYKVASEPIMLADGSPGFLHRVDDISEWKHHEHQLSLCANVDSMTSAYTRKAGLAKLEELFADRRYQPGCVAFIDIDNLKLINDCYGHNEGDLAIKKVAELLITCVRQTDWVIRYGGDEFLVLFFNCEKKVASRVMNRVRRRLDHYNLTAGKPYTLSFSAGLSSITPEMEDASALISAADQAMYRQKEQNRKAIS